MELSDFILKLKDQYLENEILIEPSSKFREKSGWDSMTGMTILLMIEEEYGVKLENEIFKKLITVEELFAYIKDNIK
jgi:acyl carrier protein